MGCKCCKNEVELSKASEVSTVSTVHCKALSKSHNVQKTKYIEYTEDIQSIRRAAKNMCLLSDHDWHIDAIKNDWNITIKDWSKHDFSGTSIRDSKIYLDIRFQQAIEIVQNSSHLVFPKDSSMRDQKNDEKEEAPDLDDRSYHGFKLVLVIGSDTDDFNMNSDPATFYHRRESIDIHKRKTSCDSLFIVAAEQKGTECRLITAHALINIPAFKTSIGIYPSSRSSRSKEFQETRSFEHYDEDDSMYDISYGLNES